MCGLGSKRTGSRALRHPSTLGDMMSRVRLAIGTFGEIGFLAAAPSRVIARARYRDWDGRTRRAGPPQRRGRSPSAH